MSFSPSPTPLPYTPMLFSHNGYQLVVMPMLSNEANAEAKADSEAKEASAVEQAEAVVEAHQVKVERSKPKNKSKRKKAEPS